MALDAPSVWGPKVAARIRALNITNEAAITNAQLDQIWTEVVTEHTAQLAKAEVAPNTFNIINPETMSPVPVTGIGGPVT